MKLMHVSLHDHCNQNAGDTVLSHATRWLFDKFLGPNEWTLHQCWDPFDAIEANKHDAVIVGGGGLLLPDQTGADYQASGWQWNCELSELDRLTSPLIVFGVGNNVFRYGDGLPDKACTHWAKVVEKACFVGVRERTPGLTYQPCPTTCLRQLGYESEPILKPILGFNVALDRLYARFKAMRQQKHVFGAMVDFLRAKRRQGWEVHVIGHKPGEHLLDEQFFENADMFYTPINVACNGPEWIIDQYRNLAWVVGMRGHAQLIPFGMGIPITSIISHDKLARFLEDIGKPEWGIDVQDEQFKDKLLNAQMPSETDIDRLQLACWDITQRNMETIATILEKG